MYGNVPCGRQLLDQANEKTERKKKTPSLWTFPFSVFVFLSFEWKNISLALFGLEFYGFYQLKAFLKCIFETIEAYEIIYHYTYNMVHYKILKNTQLLIKFVQATSNEQRTTSIEYGKTFCYE